VKLITQIEKHVPTEAEKDRLRPVRDRLLEGLNKNEYEGFRFLSRGYICVVLTALIGDLNLRPQSFFDMMMNWGDLEIQKSVDEFGRPCLSECDFTNEERSTIEFAHDLCRRVLGFDNHVNQRDLNKLAMDNFKDEFNGADGFAKLNIIFDRERMTKAVIRLLELS
jgi:hypothetical protein